MSDVGIGTIKYLANTRGVIEPKKVKSGTKVKSGIELKDLYFEVGDNEASRFREGQLVQFVVEGEEAKQVTVLSDKA